MKKKLKTIILTALLLLSLIASLIPLPAQAAEGYLEIRTKQDWLSFVKNCREDAFSKGLTVELKADLNLSGETEIMVPIFCGTFNGGGHSIKGIWLDASTDTSGLFRIIGPEASVSALSVTGCIQTGEERSSVGILCGENQGSISGCRVYGYLKSYRDSGAVAGINYGKITDCVSEAYAEGTFQTGGITGTNQGELSGCLNTGKLNFNANESAVNTGGIAGLNEGVLSVCTNSGAVGYLHTGYNVGGIAGKNIGFIEGCTNSGEILGRRDVGGITGQLEPSFRTEYGKNAMELLDNNVSGFSDALNNTMAMIDNAVSRGAGGLNSVLWQLNDFTSAFSGNVSWLFSQMYWLQDSWVYIDAIRSELQYIRDSLPGRTDISGIIAQIEIVLESFSSDDPSVWEEQLEQLMYLLGTLSEKISNLPLLRDHMANISSYFRSFADLVVNGFRNFGEQSTWILEDTVNRISGLRTGISDFLNTTQADVSGVRESVSNTLGVLSVLQGSVQDVLDGKESLSEDLSAQVEAKENGMVVFSENSANVSADYNVGGVIGNLSSEFTGNQESDALPSLDDLLFTDTTLFVRATVYACRNAGDISARYDNTGGICGYGTRGMILNCENSGNMKAEKSGAGGIAGYFRGTISEGTSIGKIETPSYAGGIAGEGKEISSCLTVPVLQSGGAYCGAVAGTLDSGSGNLFVNDSFGGVNNISYTEVARAISYEEMLQQPYVPQAFRTLTVRFFVDGEEIAKKTVSYGSAFPDYPEVENRDGKYWKWEKPSSDYVYYGQSVSGSWEELITTIGTDEKIPVFLAEGEFEDDACLVAEKLPKSDEETEPLILFPNILNKEVEKPECERYTVSVYGSDAETLTLRYHQEEAGRIYAVDEENKIPITYKRDGKYLVFSLKNGGTFMFEKAYDASFLKNYWSARLILFAALTLAAIVLLIIFAIRKKNKKTD